MEETTEKPAKRAKKGETLNLEEIYVDDLKTHLNEGNPFEPEEDCLENLDEIAGDNTTKLYLESHIHGKIPNQFHLLVPNLKSLSLGNGINGPIGNLPNLEEIVLDGSDVQFTGHMNNVKKLHIKLVDYNETPLDISHILVLMPNIDDLFLKDLDTAGEPSGIVGQLQTLSELTKLKIQGTAIINVPRFPQLQNLTLYNTKITDISGLYRTATGTVCPNMSKILLKENNQLLGGVEFLKSLPESIEEINISSCPVFLDSSAFETIDFTLFRNLKKLFLTKNGISGPVPESLAENYSILELDLTGNRFDEQDIFLHKLGENMFANGRRSFFLNMDVTSDNAGSIINAYYEAMSRNLYADVKFGSQSKLFAQFENLPAELTTFREKIKYLHEWFEASEGHLMGGKLRRRKKSCKRRLRKSCKRRLSKTKRKRINKKNK